MYGISIIFILAFVIAGCFLRKNFGMSELHKVLAIGALASFVYILIVNYSVRGSLETEEVTIEEYYLTEQTSRYETIKYSFIDTINNFKYSEGDYNNLDSIQKEKIFIKSDTTESSRNFILSYQHNNERIKFYYYKDSIGGDIDYDYLSFGDNLKIFSTKDTIGTYKINVDEYISDSKWILDISLNNASKKRHMLYIPEKHYKSIIDTLRFNNLK